MLGVSLRTRRDQMLLAVIRRRLVVGQESINFGQWAEAFLHTPLAVTIEFPYGRGDDQPVTAEGTRAFGHAVSGAMPPYLTGQ